MPAGSAPQPGEPPQYSEGTLGLTANAETAGQVWSWSAEEGYLVDDFPAFSSDFPIRVHESQDEDAPGDKAAFLALLDQAKGCGPNDDRCGAWSAYGYQSPIPAPGDFPVLVPTGAAAVLIKVQSFNRTSCGSGDWSSPSVVGWLYRTTTVVDGQSQWTEAWFLDASRTPPHRCPPGATEFEEEHSVASSDPPGPRRFAAQLTATQATAATLCPNGEPWCRFCTTHTCDYVRTDLKWWERVDE
jgi:hypothetical protein